MKAINELKAVFPSLSCNEGLARTLVAGFAAQFDPTVDELADIRTIVSEAVTNCIVHAYADSVGEITLLLKRFPEGRLQIKIRDHGCGIPDVQKAREPLFTTGGEERSGLGFSVMETLADRMRVHSRDGRGTVVTLEKYIAGRKKEG